MLRTSDAVASRETDFAMLRTREFGRLDRAGLAYLDYAGGALYAESQIAAHHALLSCGVFGNPHSENDPSRRSTALIDAARARVLASLGAGEDDYVVIFTANASAAAKLVAESYRFDATTVLALTSDNHNSINGVREYARRAGARIEQLPLDDALRLDDPDTRLAAMVRGTRGGLLAFPAQSNFSGLRHPLALIDSAHALGVDVLLDAAAFVPYAQLDLRAHPADFVVLSFYKLFGYPTGIGALVARRDALARLDRPWFAGGTVNYASVQNARHELRPLAEGFEDGTPSYLAIAGLDIGFDFLERVDPLRAARHVASLASDLADGLASLAHRDGTPLVRWHGAPHEPERGATFAFNIQRRDGSIVPYQVVESDARDAGIALRGGCFCNPGASEAAFGFDAHETSRCFDAVSGDGFSVERFARCMGDRVPVGAVRMSLGLANDERDVRRAIELVTRFAE